MSDTETGEPKEVVVDPELELAKKAKTKLRCKTTKQANSLLKDLAKETPETKADCDVDVERFFELIAELTVVENRFIDLSPSHLTETISNDDDDYLTRVIKPVKVKLKNRTSAAVAREAASVADSLSNASFTVEAKLPKMELPKFKGDAREWHSFWDMFYVAVGMNDNMPDVTKFQYLSTCLEGEAKEAIGGLSLTSANYSVAVDLLVERFGRPEKVIFHHIQDLMDLKLAASPTVKQLWAFYNELSTRVRSLENLEITADQYGVILTPLILHCLTPELRMEWARGSDKKESDLKHLMTFLKEEIECRERSQAFAADDSASSSSQPSGAALHTVSGRGSRKQGERKPPLDAFCVCGNCACLTKCPAWRRLSFPERKSKLKALHRCWKCLRRTSQHDVKNCKGTCKLCNGYHSTALCVELPGKPPEQAITATCVSHTSVLLQTVKVPVHGTRKTRDAVVLLDTGSNRTYISQNFVDKVGPEYIDSTDLSYSCFGSDQASTPKNTHIYDICMEGMNGERVNVSATCIDTICTTLTQPKIPVHLLKKIPGHDVVSIPSGSNITVDILIGMDYYWRIMKKDIVSLADGLMAQKSALGWVISGGVPPPKHSTGKYSNPAPSHQLFCQADPQPDPNLLWSLDLIGVTEGECESIHPCLESFRERVEKVGPRYAVGLPWKENAKERLVNNRPSALRRLNSLSARLMRDPDLKERYDGYFQDMLDEGVIEEVKEDSDQNPVFYLPHHPVIKESSTSTKVRPVFDASCKGYNKISLNDCMDAGPNYLPDLPALLIRFRRWQYALSADIQKAFLQVEVHEQDRDVHRFLWDVNNQIKDMRFTRVPFGNKGSPFLLMATIKHHLSLMKPSPTVTELTENLYMDDFLSGADTESGVRMMFSEAQCIMQEAGMTLTKWGSNSQSLHDMLGSDVSGAAPMGVLGMKWNQTGDFFSFSGLTPPSDICITKRVVLSMISKLFDPLGLLLPFTIKAKCLFQSIWRLKADWDEILSETIRKTFTAWLEDLDLLKGWKFQRKMFSLLWSEKPHIVLHGFGDASQQAYGACVYLTATHPDGRCESSLVISRARVAPIKSVSLPRLELLAALLCARLVTYVREALRLPLEQEIHCWTDSEITLAWLQKDPCSWKTFVANRVSAIQSLTNPSCWHHCPGKQNPADLLTRGISASELIASRLWVAGPLDLMTDPLKNQLNTQKETVEEARGPTTCTAIGGQAYQPLIDVARHSTLIKAIRVTAWVFRFIDCLRKKGGRGELSYTEMTEAKSFLVKEAQKTHFGVEIEAISNGKPLQKGSPINKLSPFLGSDDLLRVRGRLQFARLPCDAQQPVILPKGHLAKLLIRHLHASKKHAGVNSMMVELRANYWVLGARRLCKTVKRECVDCQRFDAKACSQPMAPLPEDRVTEAPPFAVTGIDHAGPLFCADAPGKKFYVLLFTCAVVRAVHLELVESLSQKETDLALRRFIARRGTPKTIWSDNAKGFEAERDHLMMTLGSEGPEWKFIPPRAPWWGGWWERLVGSTKSALRKTLGRQRLCRRELETVLHEVESCINWRPLTFVGDELDSGKVLTPAQFLLGRGSPSANCDSKPDSPSDAKQLSQLLSQQRELSKEFWSVWSDEYIQNLPPYRGSERVKGVRKGDIVLVENEGPKLYWPLAVVESVKEGKDGIARSVTVKIKGKTVVRPIQRLRKMEIETVTESQSEKTIEKSKTEQPKFTRSGRCVKAPVVMDL